MVEYSFLVSLTFFFCVNAYGLAAKLTPERDLSMIVLGSIAACPQVLFEVHKALLKCCF